MSYSRTATMQAPRRLRLPRGWAGLGALDVERPGQRVAPLRHIAAMGIAAPGIDGAGHHRVAAGDAQRCIAVVASPALAAALTGTLAEAAGSEQLIGGQMEDLRPQLYSHSTGTTAMPCFCNSNASPSSIAM